MLKRVSNFLLADGSDSQFKPYTEKNRKSPFKER